MTKEASCFYLFFDSKNTPLKVSLDKELKVPGDMDYLPIQDEDGDLLVFQMSKRQNLDSDFLLRFDWS